MSARRIQVVEVVARYAAGYFPLYDADDEFYWERLPIRAILPVDLATAQRAAKLAKRPRKKFEIRYTSSVEKVIADLRDDRVKERSWVRPEVVGVYRSLHEAGLLQTLEAFDVKTGKLAGALLGLVMPGMFIAETMFSLAADASKVCLCQLVEDSLAAGIRMIDVQTPHDLEMLAALGIERENPGATPHPCVRLGERIVRQTAFMQAMRTAARETFPGTIAEWLSVATWFTALGREREIKAVPAEAGPMPAQLTAAWRMLKHCHPAEARERIEQRCRADG